MDSIESIREKTESSGLEDSVSFMKSWKKTNAVIAGLYTVVIFAIFPLFFHNYYFDILTAKYIFYCASVISMLVVFLLTALIYIFKDYKLYKGVNVKGIFSKLSIKSLNAIDWAMLLFLGTAVISTFQSEYFYESFWGNEGRYCGLFLIILYAVSFFIISKCLIFKQWYLDVFLAAGMIACIIGILHFFNIDPIGFKDNLSASDLEAFSSTFGNINTYTSYVALVSSISTVLFSIEEHRFKSQWYFWCMVISIFALITGISDNAYLALFALLGLLPLFLFGELKGIKRYVLILTVLFTEFQVIDWAVQKFSAHVIGINGLFNIIVKFEGLEILVALLWGMSAALYLIDRIRSVKNRKVENNFARWIWLSFLILVLGILAFVLYDVNILGNSDKYGSISGYLLINDEWGTNRGYVWRLAARIYDEFPVIHKLFGYGPDTFGIITVRSYFDEMTRLYREKFDSAHNEYLQYLITIGLVGLLTYIGFIVTAILKMMRASKKTPVIMAIGFAIICYGAQAFVNISVPIVNPIMMTLIMLGVSDLRYSEMGELNDGY